MGLLSNSFAPALLAQSQTIMKMACPDLITAYRSKQTQDAMGGAIYNWAQQTTIAEDVPANIQNVSPREIEEFSRRGISVSNKVFVPDGIAVLLGDRIANPTDATQLFTVVFISDMGGEHQAFKIYVDLVQ